MIKQCLKIYRFSNRHDAYGKWKAKSTSQVIITIKNWKTGFWFKILINWWSTKAPSNDFCFFSNAKKKKENIKEGHGIHNEKHTI